MATSTTNYGFTIAEGSDSVNLLTQLYPNFTSLDSILLPIQNNGTTPATHSKAGTVHQLVRTTTGCAVLRFVATANYNVGDTFTVDGASVTATSCNGQSLPAGAFVINQSVMAIVNGAVLTVLAGGTSISDASDVAYDNTSSGLSATNVQTAIDEVYEDIPTTFASADVTYNPAVSGLTATDVQSAIDEIALGGGGGGSDHGIFELWANSTTSATFAPQTISFAADMSEYDALIFAMEEYKDEAYGADWKEVEANYITGGSSIVFRMTSGSTVTRISRSVTFAYADGSVSCTFGGGSYGSQTNNDYCIPVRILGLKHNS